MYTNQRLFFRHSETDIVHTLSNVVDSIYRQFYNACLFAVQRDA